MRKKRKSTPAKKQRVHASRKQSKNNMKLKFKQSSSDNTDMQRLVHLLQVHQIELEHQNQELRIVQNELEVSRNKYVYLFDFAPIPYLALDSNGLIKEANLSASKTFRIDRNRLIGKSFINYVAREDRDVFHSFLRSVASSSLKKSCELNIMNKDKSAFHMLLEGLRIDNTMESGQECLLALIDLTEGKRSEDPINTISKN